MKKVLLITLLPVLLCFTFLSTEGDLARKDKLSEYGFFMGELSALRPDGEVIPYSVNMPLFSNYAGKIRFVQLPENTTAVYNDSIAFEFPVGTVLIKNFYFPLDFRKPDLGRRIIETRLLVHQSFGWEAWPYIWNEEQTDAVYDPAGETVQISYIDQNGKKVTTPYAVPNKNQCKGCHSWNGKMKPIGTTARQLNRNFSFTSGETDQLQYWQRHGMLAGLPEHQQIPQLARWDDAKSGDVNFRARSYLDANCAHCHSRQGPASTSGLFLNITEHDNAHLGVNKAPVAAGRGAGDLHFDIVPGQPQKSILLFRMRTNDPAIAMPEIGREQVDKEGVALIEAWIRKYPF